MESDLKLNHIDESGESNEGIDLVDSHEGVLYQAEVWFPIDGRPFYMRKNTSSARPGAGRRDSTFP